MACLKDACPIYNGCEEKYGHVRAERVAAYCGMYAGTPEARVVARRLAQDTLGTTAVTNCNMLGGAQNTETPTDGGNE